MLPSTLREKDAQWSHYSMGWSVMSLPMGTAVLLYESGTAYVVLYVWKCTVCYADTGICCVTLLCLLNQTCVGCWGWRRSEGVGPDYDGEPQQ